MEGTLDSVLAAEAEVGLDKELGLLEQGEEVVTA
jgi:hypothetical protein